MVPPRQRRDGIDRSWPLARDRADPPPFLGEGYNSTTAPIDTDTILLRNPPYGLTGLTPVFSVKNGTDRAMLPSAGTPTTNQWFEGYLLTARPVVTRRLKKFTRMRAGGLVDTLTATEADASWTELPDVLDDPSQVVAQ
jgi:hypothetical protein